MLLARTSRLLADLLAAGIWCTSVSAGYSWPSPQYEALETFLYEGRRYDGSNLASLQHPCKNRSDTGASIGAEWLRLAYHDVSTRDAEAGTGGLDGSIAYELDREENAGQAMSASLADFESFSNKYVSRSDVIAAGTIFAVASCGGPIIPFRGGRFDAVTAASSSFSVPEPFQDFQTHLDMFRRQGFSQTEMITLVACGHTIGGVRNTDFPHIVSPKGDSEKPTLENFDPSPQYDNLVVQQYLDGSTNNPLVVHPNKTITSDFRIFSSDNNATMKRRAAFNLSSPDAYLNSCRTVLEKMLNMVPSNVALTDEIRLLQEKVFNVQLTLEHGELVFKASLRLAQSVGSTPSKGRVVRMFWCNRYGDDKDCSTNANVVFQAASTQDSPEISPITERLGYYFINHQFVVKVDPSKSISLFWFESDEHDGSTPKIIDNGGSGYQFDQDRILYVPMSSQLDITGGDEASKVYQIVAAVRSDVSPSRVYMSGFDNAIPKHGPAITIAEDLTLNTTLTPVEGYNFYSTSIQSAGLQLTVDLHADIDGNTYTVDFQQTYFLGSSLPYTPPTISNITAVARIPGEPTDTNSVRSLHPSFLIFSYLILVTYIGLFV
ncbi:hypothetical protein AGABI2DRAFT_199045 [Agaricus bisporus var. bisporus H97]|uniref:hypothetical protein n=1 Tax=Agaricus bisporus var. bisporus (strain H97 / ATCC MYA-4626 / FGSC 10389) TaxID=936046 RepID=UPI00029F6606|nr:hypothetical protein AGABI2DRAFT_199045 [Agaricus bisporus var. bisporus H97]EKV49900.1 hypothetical protein AGABI2DRAFT_199045 [Agaricus bisporus var. bisporus H97]